VPRLSNLNGFFANDSRGRGYPTLKSFDSESLRLDELRNTWASTQQKQLMRLLAILKLKRKMAGARGGCKNLGKE